jgi:hypothetical protein
MYNMEMTAFWNNMVYGMVFFVEILIMYMALSLLYGGIKGGD